MQLSLWLHWRDVWDKLVVSVSCYCAFNYPCCIVNPHYHTEGPNWANHYLSAPSGFLPPCGGYYCFYNSTCDNDTGSCVCLPGFTGQYCQEFTSGCTMQLKCSVTHEVLRTHVMYQWKHLFHWSQLLLYNNKLPWNSALSSAFQYNILSVWFIFPSNPDCFCLNGGSCTANNSTCVCPHGYTGQYCEEELCELWWSVWCTMVRHCLSYSWHAFLSLHSRYSAILVPQRTFFFLQHCQHVRR